MRRRDFLGACAAGLLARDLTYAERAEVHYRQLPPYQPYFPLMEAGHDEFPEEKEALELASRLREWWRTAGSGGEGRFYVLPGNIVRFEIKMPGKYRTGLAKIRYDSSRVAGMTAIEEWTASAARPLFRDVTGAAFEGVSSFEEQLARG